MASASTILTTGYGTGTLAGSMSLVLTLGYGIGGNAHTYNESTTIAGTARASVNTRVDACLSAPFASACAMQAAFSGNLTLPGVVLSAQPWLSGNVGFLLNEALSLMAAAGLMPFVAAPITPSAVIAIWLIQEALRNPTIRRERWEDLA